MRPIIESALSCETVIGAIQHLVLVDAPDGLLQRLDQHRRIAAAPGDEPETDHGILREAGVGADVGEVLETARFLVGDDADDFPCGERPEPAPRRKNPLDEDPPPDRLRVRRVAPHERLVDDDDRQRSGRVAIVEQASRDQPETERRGNIPA